MLIKSHGSDDNAKQEKETDMAVSLQNVTWEQYVIGSLIHALRTSY